MDVIPEARLNLVIYYLRTDEIQQAYNLMAGLDEGRLSYYRLYSFLYR